MIDFAEFLPTFISESLDNLTAFEDALMAVNSGEDDPELINQMFRSVHSIKGGAGMFDAEPVVRLAHVAESVLDLVRTNVIELSEDLLDLQLQTKDILERYINELACGKVTPLEQDMLVRDALQSVFDKVTLSANEPVSTSTQSPHKTDLSNANVLAFEIDENAYLMGFKLEPLISDVQEQYKIVATEINYKGPDFNELEPTKCYLDVKLHVTPAITEEYVEDLLSFSAGVEGRIEASTSDQQNSEPETVYQNEPTASSRDEKPVAPAQAQTSVSASKLTNKPSSSNAKVIKVSSDKLDSLVDEVGELVTLKYQIKELLEASANQQLIKLFDKSIDHLRDTALSMRLVPLGESLSRFHRTVREAAKVTNKNIRLEIAGGDTELDRITVEKLMDPLTHIIRNSCDHGIEAPAERLALGKEETGVVSITASYKGSGVSLVISDDGKGLDRDRILAKAIKNGLVSEHETLTDKQIYRLIFHAGLSTAEQVTDLSGRGVGMDVVRKNIEELGGEIEIDSALGKGTKLTIALPLTTAIMNGFAVKVGSTMLLLQLDQITECLSIEEFAKSAVQKQGCIEVRGEYIPKLELAKLLDIADATTVQEAVIVKSNQGLVALSVDKLLGELQTVIKPLDPLLQKANMFSGIVKMASGEIGFCLDVNSLIVNNQG